MFDGVYSYLQNGVQYLGMPGLFFVDASYLYNKGTSDQFFLPYHADPQSKLEEAGNDFLYETLMAPEGTTIFHKVKDGPRKLIPPIAIKNFSKKTLDSCRLAHALLHISKRNGSAVIFSVLPADVKELSCGIVNTEDLEEHGIIYIDPEDCYLEAVNLKDYIIPKACTCPKNEKEWLDNILPRDQSLRHEIMRVLSDGSLSEETRVRALVKINSRANAVKNDYLERINRLKYSKFLGEAMNESMSSPSLPTMCESTIGTNEDRAMAIF